MARWMTYQSGGTVRASALDLYAAMRSVERGQVGESELSSRGDEDDATQREGGSDGEREGSDEEGSEGAESDQKGDDQYSHVG